MGAMSIWHWIIVLLIVVLLFGRGKISDIMGDVAKGIKSFKKGMADDDVAVDDADGAKSIEHAADKTVEPSKAESKTG